MTILITGASGFIGKNLVSFLRKKYNIHLLVRSETVLPVEISDLERFVFNDNIRDLSKYLRNNKIEGIIHLASLFLKEHKDIDIKSLINSNIFLGTALLQAAVDTEIKWFINTGTFWQHYTYNSIEFCPANLYAATKEAFINIAKYYTETSDLIFTTLLLCDTYGPNDTRNKIFNLWRQNGQSGRKMNMSPGEQLIDILHIEDVVAGFDIFISNIKSAGLQYKNTSYVLRTKKRYTLRELADIYTKATGIKLNIRFGGLPYRDREVMIPWEKGTLLPNWEEKIPIKAGLKTLYL